MTIIVGVIIYALEIADRNETVAWSLFVCIVGGACAFIAFLVLLIAIIVKRPPGIKEAFYPQTLYVDPDKPKLYFVQADE